MLLNNEYFLSLDSSEWCWSKTSSAFDLFYCETELQNVCNTFIITSYLSQCTSFIGSISIRYCALVCYQSNIIDILLFFFSCRYPSYSTIRALIRCAAHVNVFDQQGNTPLHIYLINSRTIDEKILDLLCQADAHMDYANQDRRTPFDLALTNETKQQIRNRLTINLKCICARKIQSAKISTDGLFNDSLRNFVARHWASWPINKLWLTNEIHDEVVDFVVPRKSWDVFEVAVFHWQTELSAETDEDKALFKYPL